MGASITPTGIILLDDSDKNDVSHGFLRSTNGKITRLPDAPGEGKGIGQGTYPSTISSAGLIAGVYVDGNGAFHGFTFDGKFHDIDAPGAGKGAGQGTVPANIGPASSVSGYYIDSGNVYHGFLVSP
jgi:hypothetical protein